MARRTTQSKSLQVAEFSQFPIERTHRDVPGLARGCDVSRKKAHQASQILDEASFF
jgi:hypothetical protein